MGKIDYRKVEESLSKGLLKIGVDQLLHLADLATTFGMEATKKELSEKDRDQLYTITLGQIQRDLKKFRQKDDALYKKLGIDPVEVRRFIEHPEKLTEDEWEKVKEIRKRLNTFKKEWREKFIESDDEKLVEKQRGEDFRLNTREGWKPL